MSNGGGGTAGDKSWISLVVSSVGAIGTALIAGGSAFWTAAVNHSFSTDLETTKTELSLRVKSVEARLDQQKNVLTIENETYLKDRLPKLYAAIGELLDHARAVGERQIKGNAADRKTDKLRIKVLLAAAACEPRPNDHALNDAETEFDNAVEDLRSALIDVQKQKNTSNQAKVLIQKWRNFQAEVFRVAKS
jgi:hypothetical protein